MLLNQKTKQVLELIHSQEEMVKKKNWEVKALKDEVQSKNEIINNQSAKMLKLQRLLAVREVLLHTLKKETSYN